MATKGCTRSSASRTNADGEQEANNTPQGDYLEGEFEFTIGEETKIVKKGDTLQKDSNVIHGCTCLKKGVLFDVFTPHTERSLILKSKRQIGVLAAQDEAVAAMKSPSKPVSTQ